MGSPRLCQTSTHQIADISVVPVILVVDDERAFCSVMSEVLRRIGFAVHQAFAAKEALSLLQEVKPDLILADVVMPEIDGLTFVRELKSEAALAEVPVVVVSARVMSKDVAAAMEAGADAFLGKPFSIAELRSTVCSFVEAPLSPTRVPVHSQI